MRKIFFLAAVAATLFHGEVFSVHEAVAEEAVRFSFVADRRQVATGEIFAVTVSLDTPFALNAYELTLAYPDTLVSLDHVSDAGSLITVWQERAKVYKGGTIKITGASLEPFKGSGGKIAELFFRADAEGSGTLSFLETQAYMANGKGTKANTVSEAMQIEIGGEAGGAGVLSAEEDIVSPKFVYASLTLDVFNPSQKLLGFLVQDENSGVKDIIARYRTGIFWSDWVSIQNPMALPQKAWAVEIRASDHDGNTATHVMYDFGAFWKLAGKSAILLGLALIVAVAFSGILRKRRRIMYNNTRDL